MSCMGDRRAELRIAAYAISLAALFLFSSDHVFGQNETVDGETKASLYLQTLAQDIDSADYYELLSWCQRLDLDDAGDRAALQARLFSHYGVTLQPEPPATPQKRIVIQSASHSEYFTIEEIEEDYIVLRGDVVIEFIDDEKEVVHKVRAQHISINQTQGVLTASGNIEYTMIRGDNPPEVFKSQSLSFDMENWAGLFVQGQGQAEREVEAEKQMTFFYLGDTIRRLENDTVVLDQGSLTSSTNVDDPYWHIKASKIYVLAPGEWAVQDAVFHIGRVPLFFVPFFFKPGDELFFHPAIGYRNREGNFVQTTTYLLGRKSKKDSGLSFLRVTDVDEEQIEQVVKGLHLRTVKAKPQSGIAKEDAESVLKLMVDLYSRLGFFAGLFSDFQPNWSFKGGLGVSRSVFTDLSTGDYTQFGGTSKLESHWNSSYFGDFSLPFRFGVETTALLGSASQTVSGQFEYFTDPFFGADFYTRAEEIDWYQFLIGKEREAAEEPEQWALSAEIRENFRWQITSRLIFPLPSQLLNEISILKLDLQFYWQSKTAQNTSDPLLYANPSRKFFHPTRLVLPEVHLRLRGDILSFPMVPEKAELEGERSREEEPGKGFRLPPSGEEELELEPEPADDTLSIPGEREDIALAPKEIEGSSFKLSYELQPQMLIETQFDYGEWQSAQNVNFLTCYSTLDLSALNKLIVHSNLFDGLVRIQDDIFFDGFYQSRLSRGLGLSDSEWEALLLSDYQKNLIDLGNTFDFSLYPLLGYEAFAKSNLHYIFEWDFYRYRFDRMQGSYPLYYGRGLLVDDQTVAKHQIGNTLIFQPAIITHALDMSATLPPLDMVYEGEADFTLGFLNSKMEAAYRQDYPEWIFDPLVITETADLSPWINLQQIVNFDLNEQALAEASTSLKLFKLRPKDNDYLLQQDLLFVPLDGPVASSKSTLSLFGFRTYFLAEKLVPVELNLSQGRWDAVGSSKSLLPSKLFVGYVSEPVPLYLWKNRVRLESSLSASWTIDFQQYTESAMDFAFNLTLSVFEFLDLSFNVTAYNTKSYRYIPEYANALDEPWVNPFLDLLKSFNFANIEDRYSSSFNLKSIGVAAVHHLQDWQLSFEYSGEQVLVTGVGGQDEYEWRPVISVILQWHPIPEIRREIRKDEQGFDFQR